MTTDQNKNTVRQLFTGCIANKDYSQLDQVIDPSFVNHGFPGALTGPEGFRQIIEGFYSSFPDMKITIEEVIGEGDTVATRGYWTGTNQGEFMGMPATGKSVKVGYCDFWKLSNGKCTENWVQMDIAGMMQQMGAGEAVAP